MSQTIFSKSTSRGQVEIRAYRYTATSIIGQAFLAGKFLPGLCRPAALKTPQGDVTHFMGGGSDGSLPAIGLTSAEAAAINAALDAAQAEQLQTAEAQEVLATERRRTAALIREDEAREAMPSTKLMRDMDRADSDK